MNPKTKLISRTLFFLLASFLINQCSEKTSLHDPFSYSGENLKHIAVPVGGIGTGDILIGGRGNILEMEIFGKADRDELPPYMTFFSLWAKEEGKEPVAKILERELLNDFTNPFGVPRQQLAGVPRFKNSVFTCGYPIVKIALQDDEIPLHIELECYNPLIPLNTEDSGLPLAVFNWSLQNTSQKKISTSISFCISNPLNAKERSKTYTSGETVNKYIQTGNYQGILMKTESEKSNPDYGEIFVFTTESDINLQTGGYNGDWWDDAHIFWDDFKDDGLVKNVTEPKLNKGGRVDAGVINVNVNLQAGEKRTIPFYLAWYIPNKKLEENQAFDNESIKGKIIKNYYAARYSSVLEIADYVIPNISNLYSMTRKYQDRILTSTIPVCVKDALMANTAGLKTNLLLRDGQGNIHGFEGLGNDFGCCPGNCTHVWNYAQTMASLFPSLERNVRVTSFLHDTHESGYQCFRTVFPLCENKYFKNVAADGQMGSIIRVYREWKYSGDTEWLKSIWPKVKLALEFAWKGQGNPPYKYPWMKNFPIPWDPLKEGVLRGEQHNTYDINFFGPNMMTGSLYLGALKACSEMADALDDTLKSMEYLDLYKKGRETYENLLWNGEYYIQKIEVIDGAHIPERLKSPPDEHGNIIPKYQYGDGCLSDQLLGQYLSFVAGLGYILDEDHVNKALNSIYKYNFKSSLENFHNVQRVYAVNNEGGLVACTWPNGDRPVLPFVYADEVWTGIEYQVAASLIYSGRVEEGINIVESVRNRYKGFNRNPYAEIECGAYYARAMASWSVLPALCGYEYDGINRTITFDPKINKNNFSAFWSCGTGWGNFVSKKDMVTLELDYGSVEIKELRVGNLIGNKRIRKIELPGKTEYKISDSSDIIFKNVCLLNEGEQIKIILY
jgi:non-lysosomal glucosylceramidase